MENQNVLKIIKKILEDESAYKIELNYSKGDEELKVKEGYSITLVQSTFYPEDIQMALKIAKRFSLAFTIEGDRLSFYEA